MKLTKNELLNQRIDRITNQHAVIGIDIAKDTHFAQMTNYRGRILTPRHFSFTNTLEGFQSFQRWVQQAQRKHKLTGLIVGLEPTGHYWFNLTNWLVDQGVEVVIVNPVTTHRNKENRDNTPSKSDPKDALTIADAVSRGYYSEYRPQSETFERLKTIMSDREYWVKQKTSFGNRIVRWIDLYFPEFRQVFPTWTIVRSLASLRAFPLPCDLVDLTIEEVIAKWYEQGMKRAGGLTGKAKAAELLNAAKQSIGNKQALEEASRDLHRLLDAYEQTSQVLKEIDQEIEELLEIIPMTEQLRSIQGLGTITIAAILGFAGDLRHYAHGQQVLRRAGLNLAECTSGKYKGQIKLSKRGDSALRRHLYLGIIGLVNNNPNFKCWHKANQKKGLKKMASLFKLIGKLVRIVVAMAHSGETYRPSRHEHDLIAA